MKSFLAPLAVMLCSLSSTLMLAQGFTATVVDSKTGHPIPYATIQTGEHSGTITNEEGVFSLTESQVERLKDSLFISSMGYDKIGVLLSETTPTTLQLIPSTFELDQVLVTNTHYEVEEIIEKVKENLEANYGASLRQWQFFFRQSDITNLEEMDFEVKESTIEELNQALMNELVASLPQRSARYRETAGSFYGKPTHYKINIAKAADLYDESNTVSMDGVTERMERIFKENVKPDSYLKIKSGIVGAKIELDSSDTAVTIQTDTVPKDKKIGVPYVKNQLNDLLGQLFFSEETELDILEKSNRYRWELLGYTVVNDVPVFSIQFTPRGGRDFEGKMYVTMDDFAILRLDFNNVKPIKRFGLFGITYRRNVLRGKMLFAKEPQGNYRPQYLEVEDGQLVGLDRPLKVIEKNKHVKGRRKQNELDMDLKIRINSLSKYEFVVFQSDPISETDFEAFTENKKVESTTLKAYDPNFWDGYTIMEPNQAIQDFRAVSGSISN